eukprot:scaffold7595_cov267-Pinguiococcus_pyrenoidosus.AAC.3
MVRVRGLPAAAELFFFHRHMLFPHDAAELEQKRLREPAGSLFIRLELWGRGAFQRITALEKEQVDPVPIARQSAAPATNPLLLAALALTLALEKRRSTFQPKAPLR